jgi:hypothetical protein
MASDFVGYFGLLASVFLLIWLALRGVDIVFAALLSAVVIIATNQLPLANALLDGLLWENWAPSPSQASSFCSSLQALFSAG